MNKRWKLVLFLALLVAWLWTVDIIHDINKHQRIEKCEGLKIWYDEYNQQYFENKLPKDVVIDYSGAGGYMAITTMLSDGRFHIALNEKYTAAPRVAHLTLLHEQCHVATYDEIEEHGKRWRTCMLEIDAEGAFRANLIDGYEGQ
jgi:hypothetical protein